jgi:hypothetical protein
LSAAIVCNLGGLNQSAQRLLGIRRTFLSTARLTASSRFLNSVTKSGGVAGVAPFNADARRRGESTHRTIAGYVVAEMAAHLGFSVVLLASLPILVADGRLTRGDILVFGIFGAMTIGLCVAIAAAARSRSSIGRLSQIVPRLRNCVLLAFRRPVSSNEPDQQVADDLFVAVAAARDDPRGLVVVGVHALAAPAIGITLLWTVLEALGLPQGARVAVVTYTVATAFSVVGLLPAGLGFTEVAMNATLTSYGVPTTTSIAVVAVYRLFDLWLPLVAGGVALRRTHKRSVRISTHSV